MDVTSSPGSVRERVPEVSSVRAVTFDGDATLWDIHAAARAALEATAARLNRDHPAVASVSVGELEVAREEVAKANPNVAMDVVRRTSFATVTSLRGVALSPAYLDRLVTDFLLVRRARTVCYPDVVDALGRLRGRVRLGLLSNGNTPPCTVGLDQVFDHVHLASERDRWKPDPRVWTDAAQELGVPIGTVLHVGDSRREDYEAALVAGCSALLLCRSVEPPPGVKTVRTMTEVADLFDELPGPRHLHEVR
ncbi:MAG: HAD family hydrolase [Nocardioides sp.]